MRQLCVRKTSLPLLALLSGLLSASPPAWARPPATERPAITARQVRGGGGWRTDGWVPSEAVERWDIDVTRRDDTLEGVVTLEGSRLMRRGQLSGVLDGRRVHGSITDAAGNHVASFVGALAPGGGFAGTYQDRTGEVGRWSWDGPLPE
jgi:hypothetical protein